MSKPKTLSTKVSLPCFHATTKFPTLSRLIARPGQNQLASPVKKCGEPITPRALPSSQSARTAASVVSASRGSRPKWAAIAATTSGRPISRPCSNTASRSAMPTSSASTGSPVRSAVALSAKATIDVGGKVSTEKPANRSGRTEARSAVISAAMWSGSSGVPLINASGQARMRRCGSVRPRSARRSISACRPTWVNGHRMSAKTSTVFMAAG